MSELYKALLDIKFGCERTDPADVAAQRKLVDLIYKRTNDALREHEIEDKRQRFVVYNACFGGFSISRKAALRACELSSSESWKRVLQAGDLDGGYYSDHVNIPRHDRTLVRVVQELGSEASGDCAKLALYSVGVGDFYEIRDHDGYERVEASTGYGTRVD